MIFLMLLTDYDTLMQLREAINKKKCVNKENVLKGGRGSIWKPNFFIVRNKEIFSQEGGGQSQKVLIFVPIYSGLIRSFLSESSLNLH